MNKEHLAGPVEKAKTGIFDSISHALREWRITWRMQEVAAWASLL